MHACWLLLMLTALRPIGFEVGGYGFKEGDAIRIRSFEGDRPMLEAGGHYVVRGEYELGSRDQAVLAAYVTDGEVQQKQNRIVIERGAGTFELHLFVERPGYPHVSWYPGPGGDVFGGIYFGAGEYLLKKAAWLEQIASAGH